MAFSILLVAAACRSPATPPTYTLEGQVLSVSPDHRQAVVKHGDITGFMAAMTMSYKVTDPRLLDGIEPGDLISGTLVVASNEAELAEVRKVGHAAVEQPARPAASSGFEILQPGERVPDLRFTDEDGKARAFSSFTGSPAVVTFIYTACPIPDFCPLMDRHFASIQRAIKADPLLKTVHLVSVSFDPLTDTPPVLKAHARELGADPARWTFATGDRDEIDRFGARFGVSISRALDNPRDITHNLRTAIVDAEGKLVKVYAGNEWTPAQLVADLRSLGTSG